ncbi:hypothetical protein EV182_004314 [Spiromyces aspiralis]|uniref:Uncharacterized protein n=1 Tax=Spiromyces aspiralis TaxID=68401 RepID=A0ACC1HBH5_9FUNG|nr:hypothetical protein EV182_004314 [Spiromyces aspiralis]
MRPSVATFYTDHIYCTSKELHVNRRARAQLIFDYLGREEQLHLDYPAEFGKVYCALEEGLAAAL